MTISNVTQLPGPSASQLTAAEIRAELGRQNITATELARRLHVSQAWVSRRIGIGADVELTLENVLDVSEALHVPVQRLATFKLPRLDSNQQPSGYLSDQAASGAELAELVGVVVDLAAYRLARPPAGVNPNHDVDRSQRPAGNVRALSVFG